MRRHRIQRCERRDAASDSAVVTRFGHSCERPPETNDHPAGSFSLVKVGGAEGIRTPDPLTARNVVSVVQSRDQQQQFGWRTARAAPAAPHDDSSHHERHHAIQSPRGRFLSIGGAGSVTPTRSPARRTRTASECQSERRPKKPLVAPLPGEVSEPPRRSRTPDLRITSASPSGPRTRRSRPDARIRARSAASAGRMPPLRRRRW